MSTLITPATAARLNVPRADLDALHGGGWLWPDPHGWTFPEPLRRFLAPHPDPHDARQAAQALADTHPDAALDTLAHAALWEGHLTLLARVARAGQGEASLRAALRRLPEPWRGAPPALYLAGLLARAAHDPRTPRRCTPAPSAARWTPHCGRPSTTPAGWCAPCRATPTPRCGTSAAPRRARASRPARPGTTAPRCSCNSAGTPRRNAACRAPSPPSARRAT
ncbi:hypothetical protein ACFQDE_04195 [Deinococcus caeni]|uniref:hypothetical protein n=1 Tax=Deinococcus caeni TaxID=569127 RepID=UPI00360946CB